MIPNTQRGSALQVKRCPPYAHTYGGAQSRGPLECVEDEFRVARSRNAKVARCRRDAAMDAPPRGSSMASDSCGGGSSVSARGAFSLRFFRPKARSNRILNRSGDALAGPAPRPSPRSVAPRFLSPSRAGVGTFLGQIRTARSWGTWLGVSGAGSSTFPSQVTARD
jgi:hypothetical protein